jgi:hypothetical protein
MAGLEGIMLFEGMTNKTNRMPSQALKQNSPSFERKFATWGNLFHKMTNNIE